MRVTLIHNPGAGDEEHESQALRALVADAGHEVLYRSVRQRGWEQALEEPSELVAVAGGDGTVGKVCREISRKGATVTLLPVGSANNIARTLGIGDADVEELVRGWTDATRRPFDLGEATALWGETLFVESLGGGIFGDVLSRAEGVQRLRDLEPVPPALPVTRGERVELRAPDGCPLHVDDRLWPDDLDAHSDGSAVARVGRSLALLVPRV